MKRTRRQCLVRFGALLPGSMAAGAADESPDTSLARLIDRAIPADSRSLVLSAPAIVGNTAVVPVRFASTLPDTRWLHLLVDGHTDAWLASLEILPGSVPVFATHVRLERSCTLTGIAQTPVGWFRQRAQVRAVLDGCTVRDPEP